MQRSGETHGLRTGVVQHQLHVQLLGQQANAQLQAEGVLPALVRLGTIPQSQYQVGSMQAGYRFDRRHVCRHMGLGQTTTGRRRGTGRRGARFGTGHAREGGGSRCGLGRHGRRDTVPGQLAGKAMARQGEVRPPLIELRKDHRHAAAHGLRLRRQTRGAVQALHAIGRHPRQDLRPMLQDDHLVPHRIAQAERRLSGHGDLFDPAHRLILRHGALPPGYPCHDSVAHGQG